MNLQTVQASRIVTRKFFVVALQLAIAKAQRHRHCVSVIGVSCDGLQERDAEHDLLARFATLAASRTRATDVVLMQPPDAIFLMLVDADPTTWRGIFGRLVTGDHGSGLGAVGTSGWSVGGSWYPTGGADPEDLLLQASSLMTMARQDGGNRLYIPE